VVNIVVGLAVIGKGARRGLLAGNCSREGSGNRDTLGFLRWVTRDEVRLDDSVVSSEEDMVDI
jgi:hypothetical protein